VNSIVGCITTVVLALLRRLMARELKRRGVRSFRAPGLLSWGGDVDKVRSGLWPEHTTMSLRIPALGHVFIVTEGGLYASLAMHQMLTTHDWVVDMDGLRERFHPEWVREKGARFEL